MHNCKKTISLRYLSVLATSMLRPCNKGKKKEILRTTPMSAHQRLINEPSTSHLRAILTSLTFLSLGKTQVRWFGLSWCKSKQFPGIEYKELYCRISQNWRRYTSICAKGRWLSTGESMRFCTEPHRNLIETS
jgi:hypothetical protein